VISLDRLDRSNLAVGNAPEKFDEDQRLLGKIDLPSEQRRARAVFLGLVEELEGIQRRAGAAAMIPTMMLGS